MLRKYSILSEVDGRTLFSYNVENIDRFIADTDIPIGVGRKILAVRDRLVHDKSNPLLRFTSQEVSNFIKKTLNSKDKSVEKLIQEIVNRHIDGYVFYSYKDEKQFQHDFRDLKIKGLFFTKVILKRNADFTIQTEDENRCSISEKKIPTVASSQPIQEEQPGTKYVTDFIKYPVQEVISPPSENPHRQMVCTLLSLNEMQGNDNMSCQMRIIYGSWTNMNELEKKFVFFLICLDDEFTDKNQQNGLWKQINKNFDLWFELLSPEKGREAFTESRQCGVYLYNKKKTVQLSKQCKLAFVMDKDCASIMKFEIPIILVSKNIFQCQSKGLVTCLSRNPKNPEKLYFSFKPSAKYFVFDPEDYDEGFMRKEVDVYCWQEMSNTSSCYKSDKDFEDVPVTISNTVEKLPGSEKFELKDEDNTLPYPRDANIIAIKSAHTAWNEDNQIEIQVPRDFKQNSSYVIYHAGKIFSQPENDGTLFTRCLEFKSFFTCVNKAKETRLIKFQSEVLRFACGCLNARKNGTIYFGVADSVQKIDDESYKHGEVVGFQISEIGHDRRAKYTDALRDGIKKCFFSDAVSAAEKCISNPVFVKVVIPGKNIFRYIMEVDVEPSSIFCKKHHFKVNLKNIPNSSTKSVENKYFLYLRKGSSTETLQNEREQLFIKAELPDVVKERINFEDQKKRDSVFSSEETATKLERLLTRGTFKFDKRLWPILVIGKPSEEQKMTETWVQSTSFIKTMQFAAVFDFDECSNKNGLCFMHRSPERSTIFSEQKFHENAGNLQELASKLGLPYNVKTVWIFANGRFDYFEEKPHLNRSDWHESYSAGVCDAVSFFNQNFVIPKGRAVILVLLFSNDYDGLIDTFNEITRNFGWEPIVIVAEHRRIFDNFAEIIQQEGKGSKEQLEKVSVIGMPWEHVNSTITSLTGYDEKLHCVLPCSSGAFVNADERFVDTLADLGILSAKQCENKKFRNKNVRKQFAREHEMQFYKGQNVTWWNFYFENHVCVRFRYSTLHQKALTLLSRAREETRKVVTLIIAHEPGAGATTLGHQLLWHFRQKYRCCVVQKLSNMTKMHILSLWKYQEDEQSETQPKPVVLLVDDIVQTELSLSEFTRELNIEFRKNELNAGMNCLVVICQREEKLSASNFESQNIFYLKQELCEKEKQWFTDKFDELERTGRELDLEEYKPQNLISFMIMRSEFNPEYIKNTIQHLISTIDSSLNEYKLLKYVSFLATYTPVTRRGVKVFVPLECCDKLMGGKHRFWEDNLSGALKVLLVIESKEQSSGRMVRIAHPSLGRVILTEILNTEKTQLADIATEYLNCSLLQSQSYGKKFLIDFTLEMLKRRKKEEYDDEKTTKFSPLIEEIMSASSKNYEKAAEILQLGFDKFKDYMLAQALARLYSMWKKYDEAIKWAKEAVDLSSKASLSYILHTYGLVLREKFKHSTNEVTFLPKNVHEHLELILESLDVFLRAQRERDDEADTENLLYPFHDTIHTINEITKFLTENVMYQMDKKFLVRYLKEKEYVPEEISSEWVNYHVRLKQMQEQGHAAFKVLEDNVCFNTTFYAPEVLLNTSQKMKEHRFYRSFHYGHERLLEKFSRIYGEPGPPGESASQLAKDSYHRGKLWTLKGNSYMNIFNHIKNSMNLRNSKELPTKLCEIKDHITKIEMKDPTDLANQVCVNIAIGIIGYRSADSVNNILKICQQIIDIGREKVDLAHFFISMLLWPCESDRQPYYDDLLLQKSLSYLKRNFKQQKNKQSSQKSGQFFREERNISQPTPQFFLAKGKGLKSLCHRWQMPVFVRVSPDSQFDNSLWDHHNTKEKLRCLHGTITTVSDGSSNIIVFNHKHGEPIKISKIRGTNKGFVSEEEVSFYLGFSIAGPIAYNVKLRRHESQYPQTYGHHDSNVYSKSDEYMKYSKEELQTMLMKIRRSEVKRPEYRKEREVGRCVRDISCCVCHVTCNIVSHETVPASHEVRW